MEDRQFCRPKNIQTCENFYKYLFESSREYAWKRDLNRLRKCFLDGHFAASFMYLELRRGHEEDGMKVGESKVEVRL